MCVLKCQCGGGQGNFGTRPERASKYASGRCPVKNSGHDNLGEGLGRYPGGRPAISHSTTPC